MSGDENDEVRGVQISEVMRHTKEHFTRLPNLINMGDFNVRGSEEPFYQTLTDPEDTNFRFFDPPFFPDHKLKYPANWNHDPAYSSYFTTSTRESASVPNPCGTGGGGKNWYDHIFLSSWIVNNINYMRYIPNSYRTIGNDGQRLRVSINNNNGHANTSAPQEVIDALYQMSNKYPVMVDLEVSFNSQGTSVPDPEIKGVAVSAKEDVSVDVPVKDKIVMHFSKNLIRQEISVECFEKDESMMKKILMIKDTEMQIKCDLKPGTYVLKVVGHHNTLAELSFTKD